MKNLNDLIDRYTVRYDRKIKKLCEPLAHLGGIQTFSYYSIDADGRFVIMSNYPKQLEFFYGNQLYHSCPYMTHPSLFRSGHALVPVTSDPHFQKRSRKEYQMDHLFLLLQQTEKCMEGFFFTNEGITPKNAASLLSYLDLFKKFGNHFKQEAASLIRSAREEGYNLQEAKGDAFLKIDPLLPLSKKDPAICSFLKATDALTPRERECLELFQKGRSAQATASILGLSRRTVEYYFENIKNKLGCSSKWDLLDR